MTTFFYKQDGEQVTWLSGYGCDLQSHLLTSDDALIPSGDKTCADYTLMAANMKKAKSPELEIYRVTYNVTAHEVDGDSTYADGEVFFCEQDEDDAEAEAYEFIERHLAQDEADTINLTVEVFN